MPRGSPQHRLWLCRFQPRLCGWSGFESSCCIAGVAGNAILAAEVHGEPGKVATRVDPRFKLLLGARALVDPLRRLRHRTPRAGTTMNRHNKMTTSEKHATEAQ